MAPSCTLIFRTIDTSSPLTFVPLKDPVGLPHRSTEDDWYDGQFIPAGTIIMANVYHLNRDPELHGADAHEFNPARHLDEKGNLAPALVDTKEESHFTYGFGRKRTSLLQTYARSPDPPILQAGSVLDGMWPITRSSLILP